jgi:hypothetical protein
MNPPGEPLRASLGVAASVAERDEAIRRWLSEAGGGGAAARRVVLVEGLLFDRPGPEGVPLVGLPAGCPCCAGLLPLRVALGRTLRSHRPEGLLILLAGAGHLPRLRRLLEDGSLGVRMRVET